MKKKIKLNQEKIFYLEINEKIYYIIFFAAFSLLRRVFPFIIQSFKFGELKKADFNKSSLFDMLSNFLADLLAGLYKIYLCFIKKKNKIKKNNLIENLDNKEYDTADPKLEEHKQGQIEIKEKLKSNLNFIMIVISIVDIIAQLCIFAFSYYDKTGSILGFQTNEENNNENFIINEDDLIFTVAISIFFRYFFSRLFLKLYIYYHIKISIFITFISFIPLLIFNIIALLELNKSADVSKFYVYIILIIINTIFYSFEDIMNKLAFMKAIIRPYDLMFYKALIQIFFFIPIIIFVILFDIYHDKNNLLDYLYGNLENWYGRIAYRLPFIIFNLFRTYFLMLVIEKIDQNELFIALFILKALEFVVLSLFSLIKDLIKAKGNNFIFFIIEFICCIFMFFASCIANEVIIINRLNLAKETNFYKGNKTDDNENEQFEKDQKYIEENYNDESIDNSGIN